MVMSTVHQSCSQHVGTGDPNVKDLLTQRWTGMRYTKFVLYCSQRCSTLPFLLNLMMDHASLDACSTSPSVSSLRFRGFDDHSDMEKYVLIVLNN